MGELTSSVTDKEIIAFFMSAIVPHVLRYQKPILMNKMALDATSASSPSVHQAKEEFVEKLGKKLEVVMEESEQEEVFSVTIINVSNSFQEIIFTARLSQAVWSNTTFLNITDAIALLKFNLIVTIYVIEN